MLGDKAIRECLTKQLEYENHNPFVIHELGLLNGDVIADVVFCHPSKGLTGYEIKSDKDTLYRLGRQVKYYDLVMARCWLVVGAVMWEKKQDQIEELLGDHWGIMVVIENSENNYYYIHKTTKPNPHQQTEPLLKLLWAAELAVIYRHLTKAKIRGSRAAIIRHIINTGVKNRRLNKYVYQCLKARKG